MNHSANPSIHPLQCWIRNATSAVSNIDNNFIYTRLKSTIMRMKMIILVMAVCNGTRNHNLCQCPVPSAQSKGQHSCTIYASYAQPKNKHSCVLLRITITQLTGGSLSDSKEMVELVWKHLQNKKLLIRCIQITDHTDDEFKMYELFIQAGKRYEV